MRKVTDFIVEKRIFILSLFIVFTIVSIFLSKQVKINYDMTEYLPNESETKTGLKIMDKEFNKEVSSYFNIMFEDLSKKEKQEIYEYLDNIKGVSEVNYDIDSKDYNKDKYTLYTINVKDTDDSKKAKNVYNDVINKYDDYTYHVSGPIAIKNGEVLPLWIIVVAILICLVVLIIMCESYVEPFLFLLTIGIAVVLNNGTNIIFPYVSNVTSSIAAILQMALSMDYSIMLMERYRQESEKTNNDIEAMKEALNQALKSISSSSLTTIVGLLALIFMSFTIGRDLGFVLAKGVLFSLISIFFCLPALILIFDKLIKKTKKKTLNFKMDKFGKFSYKIRYISLPILLLCFGISFVLKGNLKTLYTTSEKDKIKEVFEEPNQMVIVYKNNLENKISDKCLKIEKLNKVDNVLCYGNTINQSLTYKNLKNKIKDFGMSIDVDDYLLKIIYYSYYNKKENKIEMEDLVHFLKDKAKENNLSNIDDSSLEKLEDFTTIKGVSQKRSISNLASLLNIDENSLKTLMILYNTRNVNQKMSVPTFISFLKNDVLKNPTFSNRIPSSAIKSINTLENFTDKKTINSKLSYNQMASLFGMDFKLMSQLYLYYYSINGVDSKLSINDFSNFVIKNEQLNTTYSNLISKETKDQLNTLATFSDKKVINKNMSSEDLSKIFSIPKDMVDKILLLYYGNMESETSLTITEFIKNTIYLKENTTYLNDLDVDLLKPLLENPDIQNDQTKYKASNLALLLSLETDKVYKIFALIDYTKGNTDNWKISPYNFVKLVLDNVNNDILKSQLDSKMISSLNLVKTVMDSTIQNKVYTYSELASILNVSLDSIKSIYSLYDLTNNKLTMTPKQVVDFILKNSQNDLLKGKINKQTLNELTTLKEVMNGIINNKTYSYKEITSLFNMNKQDLKLLYSYYELNKNSYNINMSLKELINFILDDVITDSKYKSLFSLDSLDKLKTLRQIIYDLENHKEYTSLEFKNVINKLDGSINQDTVDLLYLYYGSVYDYQNNYTLTIEKLINYLNDDILNDSKYQEFIDQEFKDKIKDAKKTIKEAKDNLVGSKYSRAIINTKLDAESNETFKFIKDVKKMIKNKDVYFVGDSLMAYEMNDTFDGELNFITILTMISIFMVVALTFKSISIPTILVLIIQTAVFVTMGVLTLLGGSVYFIALLIVQSILMGATIDYAIVFTAYYEEVRKDYERMEAVILAYNKSIPTILTSSSILIVATFTVGVFAQDIASKICITLCQGTICSVILIIFLLPSILVLLDKLIIKKN